MLGIPPMPSRLKTSSFLGNLSAIGVKMLLLWRKPKLKDWGSFPLTTATQSRNTNYSIASALGKPCKVLTMGITTQSNASNKESPERGFFLLCLGLELVANG